ncbi:MAG: hypothetical protein QGG71_02950 [Pirellulaceae bacterium]|nr:hypothetical protein [Pirellulaceae bacterium]
MARAARSAKTAKTSKTSKATTAAKAVKASKEEITVDRRTPSDRRDSTERRSKSEPVGEDRRDEVRRKVPRRRQIDPTTCERDYSDAEIEFMQAMDDYKRANGRMFPTCSEILEVLQKLGYDKVSPASSLADDETSVPPDGSQATDLEDEGQVEVILELEQPPADEEI